MVVVARAASCLLKGQLHPLGSVIRLRASPRMYPRKVQGPPRGPSLTAALQGRWVRDAASALPPSPLYFPFGSLQGWVGAGRASPPGLGSPSHPLPLWPFAGAGAAPGYSRPGDAADPSMLTSVRPAPSGSWAARGGSPWVCEQGLHYRGNVTRRPGVGPPAALESWRPAEGAARLALAPDLTDVKEKLPARDCRALKA